MDGQTDGLRELIHGRTGGLVKKYIAYPFPSFIKSVLQRYISSPTATYVCTYTHLTPQKGPVYAYQFSRFLVFCLPPSLPPFLPPSLPLGWDRMGCSMGWDGVCLPIFSFSRCERYRDKHFWVYLWFIGAPKIFGGKQVTDYLLIFKCFWVYHSFTDT